MQAKAFTMLVGSSWKAGSSVSTPNLA